MTANTPKMVGSTHKQLSTLTRAKFGPGMLLQHEDLEQMTDYTRELSRLLFRSFFGCGVVCGLVVKAPPPKCGRLRVTVEPGVALDCNGDPVYVPKEQTIDAGDCDKGLPEEDLWVVLCGTAKSCAPRRSECDGDYDGATDCIPTRERDAFEIRVVKGVPGCVCQCPDPKRQKGGEGRAQHDSAPLPADGQPAAAAAITGASLENGGGTPEPTAVPPPQSGCSCVELPNPCYDAHYEGKCCSGCGCDCNCGGRCAGSTWCDCVLLAKLVWNAQDKRWKADHSYRRFIRPVLMRDREPDKDETRYQDSGAAKLENGSV